MHKDVRWPLLLGGLVSAISGVFGWVGLVSPSQLGWDAETPWIVKLGLVLLICLPLLWLFAVWQHLRAVWVYRYVAPVTLYLQLEVYTDSDSTAYYAVLRSSRYGSPLHSFPVYPPQWPLQSGNDSIPAQVFIDPRSGQPLVIEIEKNRLWRMLG